MSNLPFNVQSFAIQPADVKVFDTGHPNDFSFDPPGWAQPGFDDSGWATAVAPNPVTGSTPPVGGPYSFFGAGYGPFMGPTAFAPWATVPGPNGRWLARTHITVPDGWKLFAIYAMGQAQVFGTAIGVNGTGFGGRPSLISNDGYIYSGETGALVTGDNLITAASDSYFGPGFTTWGAGGITTPSAPPFISWIVIWITIFQPTNPGFTTGKVWGWGTPVNGVADLGVLGVNDTLPHLTATPVYDGNFPLVPTPNVAACDSISTAFASLVSHPTLISNHAFVPGAAALTLTFTATNDGANPLAAQFRVDVGGESWFQVVLPGTTEVMTLEVLPTWTVFTVSVLDPSGFNASTNNVAVSADIYCGTDHASIAKVVSNGTTTLFLTGSGRVYVCGDNTQGFFGNGGSDANPHPVPVYQLTSLNLGNSAYSIIVDIDIGQDCALALTNWGGVVGWGPNAYGSLSFARSGTLVGPVLRPSLQLFGAMHISCGATFSCLNNRRQAFVDGSPQSTQSIFNIGDNTYGQAGNGTIGGTPPVQGGLSIASAGPVGPDTYLVDLSAGDGCGVATGFDPSVPGFIGVSWGRGDLGQAGAGAYLTGHGPFHIANPGSAGGSIFDRVEQAGPLTFSITSGEGGTTPGTMTVIGDGTPYGGAGDTLGNIIWGAPSPSYGFVAQGTPNIVIPPNVLFSALVSDGGGSQNPWTAGVISEAVYAGVGLNGLLYTWGWGGAGQMGSGADALTNVNPIAVNGLTQVIGGAVANGIIFGIALVATPPLILAVPWAQVIG